MDELFDQLYQQIKYGRLAAVEEYLNNGGDSRLTNRNGWSLLMVAAFKGNSRILRLLLDHGGMLEDSTVVGETALALAAGRGYVKCVKLLLERGASIDIHPLGHPLSVYMEYCGGPYPNVQKLLAKTEAER